MNKIKIATLWTGDLKGSLIFKLIENITRKEIQIVPVNESDILFFGPYETNTLKRRFLNIFKKRFTFINDLFPNIDFYLLNRKIKPIRIFYSHENYQFPNIHYDYSITSHLGIDNETHLRFPLWKDLIDWSHLGIKRELSPFIKRYDNYYNIKDLMSPQDEFFLKKERKKKI